MPTVSIGAIWPLRGSPRVWTHPHTRVSSRGGAKLKSRERSILFMRSLGVCHLGALNVWVGLLQGAFWVTLHCYTTALLPPSILGSLCNTLHAKTSNRNSNLPTAMKAMDSSLEEYPKAIPQYMNSSNWCCLYICSLPNINWHKVQHILVL